jgi:branched-chain amino acid transport system ATP-binding protein
LKPIWGEEERLLLEAKNISVYYGTVKAIEDVSFHVNQQEIVVMIGPNGAGKSTALKAVFGLVDIDSGDILFNGESIKGLRPDEHVPKGISLIPEGRRLFPSMTVLENLETGALFRRGNDIKADIEGILELFPGLKDKEKTKVGVLSTGEQQMVAIGRALLQRPKLLLADEPSLGLSPSYVDKVFDVLIEINKSGIGILLVEQNARMALEISHRGYIFKTGSILLEDSSKDLLESEVVKKAFLGG